MSRRRPRRRPRGSSTAGAAALCLLLGACAASLGANVAGNARTVKVPTPSLGRATVALLRFYVASGNVPILKITNRYNQPPSAAFVGGVAPVGPGNTRFVALVVIANFRTGAGSQARKGAAGVESTQPFFVDYVGDLQSAGSQVSAIQAIMTGIPGPEAWTVDWFNQPPVVTTLSQGFVTSGQGLLDQTFRHLLNLAVPGFDQALAGPQQPKPGGPAQVAGQAKKGARATAQASKGPAARSPSAGAVASTSPGSPTAPTAAPSAATSLAAPTAPTASPPPGVAPSPTPSAPATPISTMVVSDTTGGPYAPGTRLAVTSSCPAGTTLVGGGFFLHTTVDGENPNNSFRDWGEFASASDGSPIESGSAQSYTTWGGAGGQAMNMPGTGAIQVPLTTNFAMCASGWSASIQIVVQTTSGAMPASTAQQATATCPAGTALIGGGADLQAPSPTQPGFQLPSPHLIGDYPSDPGGNSPANASVVNSWTAASDSGGTAIPNTATTAFAMCASHGPATEIAASSQPGPLQSSSPADTVATCPSGTVLLSGGVRVFQVGGVPQHGIHLVGGYPGTGDPITGGGAPVASGPAGQSWVGISHAGGLLPGNPDIQAFAVCAR